MHRDYIDLYFTNPFVNSGKLTLNEKTIDMSKVKADSYVIAGVTDHITPWKGVYKTAQIIGEGTTFVLSATAMKRASTSKKFRRSAS